MQSRPPYAIVGLFVVLLTAAIIVTGVWFGFGDPKPTANSYFVYLTDSVAGLRENSTVRYRGVDVGRVRDIDLAPGDPGRVLLVLDIDRTVPVLTDTVARLSTQGLTGLSYVELTSEGEGEPLVARPGEEYPVITSRRTLMGRIDTAGGELLARVDEATRELAEAARRFGAVFDDDNREAVSATLADIRLVAATLGGRAETLGQGIDDLGALLADAAEAGERLPELVERTELTLAGLDRHAGTLAGAAQAVERLADTLRTESERLSGRIDRTTTLTEQELVRFSSETQPALTRMLHELEGAAVSLRRLGETLERDPSLLLYGHRDRPLGPGEGGVYPVAADPEAGRADRAPRARAHRAAGVARRARRGTARRSAHGASRAAARRSGHALPRRLGSSWRVRRQPLDRATGCTARRLAGRRARAGRRRGGGHRAWGAWPGRAAARVGAAAPRTRRRS
jgi:phospholipid/cholesterol/gamma-HCH transport system substrate-binding protein